MTCSSGNAAYQILEFHALEKSLIKERKLDSLSFHSMVLDCVDRQLKMATTEREEGSVCSQPAASLLWKGQLWTVKGSASLDIRPFLAFPFSSTPDLCRKTSLVMHLLNWTCRLPVLTGRNTTMILVLNSHPWKSFVLWKIELCK